MFKIPLNKKVIGRILEQKPVRVAIVLNTILIIICITLFSVSHAYNQKIAANETQIMDVQTQLRNLQMIANQPETEEGEEIVLDRSLAPYDEIVPFISFLESLFSIIDKESRITIKDEENQIMINRFADYMVNLKPGEKIDLLLKALDSLYKSEYLTKITNLEVNYAPPEDGRKSSIDNISLIIRLYFE